MDLKQEIFEVVRAFKPDQDIDESLWNVNLMNIGISSFEYIQLLVAIEGRLGIEFPDDALDIEKLPTLQLIGEFVAGLK